MNLRIDLNADLGEGDAHDAELLTIVSSCNIACGGHAGDVHSMRATVAAAMANNVSIGAHPSYPDREGFGRRSKFLSGDDLHESLLNQIRSLVDVCDALGASITHVKPHGALYNDAANDPILSTIIISVINELKLENCVVGPPESELSRVAEQQGVTFIREAFADRAYQRDGQLEPRNTTGAVHSSTDAIAAQAVSIAVDHRVAASTGEVISIAADTLCIHGDTPGAAAAARQLRAELEKNGVEIRAIER